MLDSRRDIVLEHEGLVVVDLALNTDRHVRERGVHAVSDASYSDELSLQMDGHLNSVFFSNPYPNSLI